MGRGGPWSRGGPSRGGPWSRGGLSRGGPMRGSFGGGMARGGHGSAGAQSTQQNEQQQGTNNGNAVDRYGNPVQCHACGEWGHFWRHCKKWLAFMNSG
eukprot:1367772-Rhodomonas_salina.1